MEERKNKLSDEEEALANFLGIFFVVSILSSFALIIFVLLKLHDYTGILGWVCVAVMIIEFLIVVLNKSSGEQLFDNNANQEKILNRKVDIIEAFWNAQVKKNIISLIGISIFFIVYFIIHIKLEQDIEYTIPIIFIALGGLIVIKQILTAYRIKRQYFGTNYEEAKEIVYFILESNNDDLNNGKFIFNEEKNEIPMNNEQIEYS